MSLSCQGRLARCSARRRRRRASIICGGYWPKENPVAIFELDTLSETNAMKDALKLIGRYSRAYHTQRKLAFHQGEIPWKKVSLSYPEEPIMHYNLLSPTNNQAAQIPDAICACKKTACLWRHSHPHLETFFSLNWHISFSQ